MFWIVVISLVSGGVGLAYYSDWRRRRRLGRDAYWNPSDSLDNPANQPEATIRHGGGGGLPPPHTGHR